MPRTVAPFGTWVSPVTAELLVERAIGLGNVEIDGGLHGGRVAWTEARPSEGGRQVVVAAGPGGQAVELTPPGYSARTRVHEYGGRCAVFAPQGTLVASNWDDQRLWAFAAGADPVPLTPAPAEPAADRYADPVVTPDGAWVVCVRERHRPDGTVTNDVVAVPMNGGGEPAEPLRLAGGRDFYAAPRLSPDGRHLAWLCWDHPAMPWDRTELWCAELLAGEGVELAGATVVASGASITQPAWSPGGILHHVSDRSGWWNLYRGDEALCPMEAEFADLAWVFGTSNYGFAPDGTILATWHGPGGAGLGPVIDGEARPLALSYSSFSSVAVTGGSVVAIAGSPTEAPAVVRVEVATGTVEVLRRSREAVLEPAWVSVPDHVRFPTGPAGSTGTAGSTGNAGSAGTDSREEAWAFVYPPTSPTFAGPEGHAPPLVVMTHGGPTSAASATLNLAVQYWTSRGFAVADVDYRGSTGYGRSYRERLAGSWGLLDVEDVAAVVRFLAAEGRIDPSRAVIRGGSAGGYTTLAALAFTDVFAGGASLYGVADLTALAAHTHKFESSYLDGLVGPWPEAAATYRQRSPIDHLEGFTCPLILFQGLEDRVVPPAQSEMIHRALLKRGVPVAYLAFEGEQHGFRRTETIQAVAAAELAFYGRVLGFEPPGAGEVAIENADALGGPR